MKNIKTKIFLTAVVDSKICWRVDNFLGSQYRINMEFWDYVDSADSDTKKKSWVKNEVALVHHIFRKGMGAVDQRDVKSYVMKLMRETVRAWHDKQIRFLIETAVCGAHSNYNLDPSTEAEHFTDWYDKFIHEMLTLSKNYRKYKLRNKPKCEQPQVRSKFKRAHVKKTPKKQTRRRIANPYGTPTLAGLTCYGRSNLGAFLDLTPVAGTEHMNSPKPKRIKCRFCGRSRILYKCSACGETFCM